MADYLVTGNKNIQCRYCNHSYQIPFQTTITKCPICGKHNILSFRGVVKDKHDNYVH